MPWTLALLVVLAQGPASTRAHDPDIAPPRAWDEVAAPFETVESVTFVPVAEVNLETARAWKVGLEWPTRALDVGLHAVGPLVGPQIQIRTQADGEGDLTVWISIIQYGLRDDSVAGQRDDLELKLQLDGSYRVRAHERSHACWRGPETQAWIAEPCS